MKLFFLKAWRDLKRRKIRSVPIFIVIIIGGMASIMYSNIYLTWVEATNASWEGHNYHHLLVTVTPMDAGNLTQLVNKAQINSSVYPDFEVRSFFEVKVSKEAENSSITAHLYGVDSSRPLLVDTLYYHSDTINTLENSSTANVSVIDQFTAELNDWQVGDTLTISLTGLDDIEPFNVSTIAHVDSPEYLVAPGAAATEFFDFWSGPVIWMRYNDLLSATNNQAQANQVAFHFDDPSKKNIFLEELFTVLGENNVLHTEGRNWYIEVIGLEMLGMGVIMAITFSGIAAILLFIVLKRIIEEELPTLGLFKSLGFTNRELTISAVFYSLIISLIGGIIGSICGAIIGIGLSDYMIFELAGIKKLPIVEAVSPISILPAVSYFLLTCILTTVGSLFAIRKIYRMQPLDAMKPKVRFDPGKVSFAERAFSKFRSLSPLTKFSIRSLFQDKRKAFFVLAGIFLATFISFFGSNVTINYYSGFDRQINYYQNWDLQVIFGDYQNESRIHTLVQENAGNILENESAVLVPIRFSQDLSRIYSLTGLIPNSNMRRFDNDIFPAEGELAITKDLALKFKVGIGDDITLEAFGESHSLTIGNILNELSGLGIYSSINTARILAGENKTNVLFLKASDPDQLSTKLEQEADVYRVINKNELIETIELVNNLTMLLISLALFAGLLVGVSIAVTIVSISISERKHDFVNFRALGVSNKEIFTTILLELIITGIGGVVLGFIGSMFMINALFDWAATLGVILIFELSFVSIIITTVNVCLGIILATYLSLRSLFRTSISEETVSRIIG
ncbi:MAG: FtsX-like permease family protein [Candidatus Heimdallarchaeota archaeon]|nr:MAG: FtsX-like permease family protein [Candidatus Heimdallarchaeota archaeon]